MRPFHPFTGALLCVLVAGADVGAQQPFYRKARPLDITGKNPRDSIVLVATGTRADQLKMAMTFYVSGAPVHVQHWGSADELDGQDDLKSNAPKLSAHMRNRLDAALTQTKREPINAEQVKHMGDAAVLKRIAPKPTHQIALSFGFENTLYFVWDPSKQKLVMFMECC